MLKRHFTGFWAAIAAVSITATLAQAECGGRDLLADMPRTERATLADAVAKAPYTVGNLWRATKAGAEVTLVGTYHLDDPRHLATMNRIEPLIRGASSVLVESGPEQEAAMMKAMADNPGLLLITEGPSLLEQLPPDEWARVAAAMRARSIPPFMAAKFRPWYVAVMLGMPPCAMQRATPGDMPNGLDQRVITVAETAGIPVQSLESFDMIFELFNGMTPFQQIRLIQSSMLFEDMSEDFNATLANAYFAEDSYTMWEYMRQVGREMSITVEGLTVAEAEAEFALMEETMVNARNRAWIPVIEQAASKGPLFIAFGALHLPGEQGVLNLLEQAGWTLERLPL